MAQASDTAPRSSGDEPDRESAAANETVLETDPDAGLEVTTVDSIRAIDRSRWNDVVRRSHCGSVFHRHEWLAAIESGLGYPAEHLIVEKDGNLIGLLPNFVVDIEKTPFRRLSSIYPGFGGPVVTTDVADSLSLLAAAVPECCSGRTIVHQIRGLDTDYLRYNNRLQSEGYRPYRRECRFVLDLTQGYDRIEEGMSRTRRRGIRKGRETDHEIVEEELTRENLRRFYRVYRRVMDRVGGDIYPFSFFEHLLELRSRLLLLTVRIDGEYAGGFLELLDEERNAIHGFFAAVPEEYFDDHASELLYDRVFRWGIDHGYETYDFGSTNASFEDGVFRFKEGFGGQPIPILVWERGCSPLWPLVKAGRSLYWPYHFD
ncbi:GNAT family N-acetyltransferase [Halopiger thermotolerans]